LAIVLGTILDGIPESIVLGLSLLEGGGVSVAMFAAVFLSNLPEALSSTAGLSKSDWERQSILGLWTGVTVVSGLSALAGYAFFDGWRCNVTIRRFSLRLPPHELHCGAYSDFPNRFRGSLLGNWGWFYPFDVKSAVRGT
jgi:hypothetical protein